MPITFLCEIRSGIYGTLKKLAVIIDPFVRVGKYLLNNKKLYIILVTLMRFGVMQKTFGGKGKKVGGYFCKGMILRIFSFDS